MPHLRRLFALLSAALLAAACRGNLDPSSGGTGGSSATTTVTTSTTSAGGTGGTGGAEPEVPYCNRGPSSLICNPYGLALDRAAMSDGTYWSLLGDVFDVDFYRPETLYLDQFEKDPTSCASCEAAAAQGYYLVLVVRNDGGPSTPSNPPADLDIYQASIARVVERYKSVLATVVIEHEADSPASYAGTPAQYLAQLAAGCRAAHQKSAHCTDSGVASTSMLLWLARYYADNGNANEALRILATATGNPEVPALFTAGQASEDDAKAFLAGQQARIDRADALLAGHREAGVDSANFHWYEASETTLNGVIAILRARTGCYRVMTDEMGQRGDAPLETEFKLVLSKELGLPFVVWRSSDTDGARSLVDETGALRPTGERFALVSTTAICAD